MARGGEVLGTLAAGGWALEADEIEPREAAEDWLLAATGDDEWCVLTVRGAADRAALAAVCGGADHAAVAAWVSRHPPAEAAAALQAAGVPAGWMVRAVEMPEVPQYRARGLFREAIHPLIADPFMVEGAPTRSARMPPPDQRPAPRVGEHSLAVLRAWLGLEGRAAERLMAHGIIEQAE